jgi:hypothetical protein
MWMMVLAAAGSALSTPARSTAVLTLLRIVSGFMPYSLTIVNLNNLKALCDVFMTSYTRRSARALSREPMRPDPDKLEQARILYQNSKKTASEICRTLRPSHILQLLGNSEKSGYNPV